MPMVNATQTFTCINRKKRDDVDGYRKIKTSVSAKLQVDITIYLSLGDDVHLGSVF
jgi:hypothetical protein